MPRNLDRRVEAMFPVESDKLKEQIRQEVVGPALSDNSSSYRLDEGGIYTRRTPAAGETAYVAQTSILARRTASNVVAIATEPGAAAKT